MSSDTNWGVTLRNHFYQSYMNGENPLTVFNNSKYEWFFVHKAFLVASVKTFFKEMDVLDVYPVNKNGNVGVWKVIP